ncbi:MAG: Rrf2 family transcriptional regulator [Trueperaceae bacterium]
MSAINSTVIHVLALLEVQSKENTTSERMAQSIGTNPVVVRRVVGQLQDAGFVRTRLGVGVAELVKPVDDITLLEVVFSGTAPYSEFTKIPTPPVLSANTSN